MQRTLRSKAQRALLWYSQDGKCAICGEQLGDDWEADHIIPWRITHRTNVHEMQALCATCNRKKGGRAEMVQNSAISFRKYQAELYEFCEGMRAGRVNVPRIIGGHIACGGGKQVFAGIIAHFLIERMRYVDKVCWVVPNGTLREQAAQSLLPDQTLAQLLPHNLGIYESINNLNPSKGKSGYAITYHALAQDGGFINRQEFDKHRYLLIFDEPHHLAVGSPIQKAAQPLVDRARMVVLMSGTLDRHDRRPVHLLNYQEDGTVDTASTADTRWFRYSIRDGMMDQAIIRVGFNHGEGEGQYIKNGEEYEFNELGNNRDALFAVLQGQYAKHLLDKCVEHWQGHRHKNPRSKLLVVCANTGQAKAMHGHLTKRGVEAGIATYKEEDADAMIRRFKGGKVLQPGDRELSVLVTVAMAYEGLDVPAITHIACLTHIRSRPWIEQMIARAWRCDREAGPYRDQQAFVFCPDDDLFKWCIRDIETEQQLAANMFDDYVTDSLFDLDETERKQRDHPDPLTVISSGVKDWRYKDLHGDALSPEETAYYEWIAQKWGKADIPPTDIKRLRDIFASEPDVTPPTPPGGSVTPQQELDSLLEALDKLTGRVAYQLSEQRGWAIGEAKREVNTLLYSRIGRRAEMTADQVKEAIKYVQRSYAVN